MNPSEPLPPPDHLDSIVGDFSARIDLKATPAEQHQQAARLAEELGLTGEQFREVLNLLGLPESPAAPVSFAATISHPAAPSAHPTVPEAETLFEPDESANRPLPDAPDSLAGPGDRTVTDVPTERTLFEGDTPDTSPSSLQDPTRSLFGLDELEPLAQGGMGQILRGVDPKLGRQVALKVILPEVRGSQRIREKFLNEARITSQLEHPGIIPVHKLGQTTDGRDYFTMKLVRGTTLEQALHELRNRKDPKAVLRARPQLLRHFLKICDALALAHSRQVIHRDLKPENIMIGEFGEVLVMDWGLAKFLDETEPSPQAEPSTMNLPSVPTATLDGQVQGTPSYMSPEQVEGKIDVIDQKSDIYALGTILYEILCLERAFAGRKIIQIFARIRAGRFASPRERSPHLGIPHELEAVTLKAMASDPAQRYASVPQLQNDIQSYLDGRILEVARYSPLQRLRKWVAKNRTLCMTTAATVVLTSILFGVNRWREHNNTQARFQNLIERSNALLHDPRIIARFLEPRNIVDKSTGLEHRESPADKEVRQTILKSYLARARLLEQALQIEPNHPEAQQQVIEVVLTIGKTARWGHDFLLAKESFERLETFGYPKAKVNELLAGIKRAEQELRQWRKDRLDTILADLGKGLSRKNRKKSDPTFDDYLFEVVSYRSRQTVTILQHQL
ncbi:MAG: serine/threonine-protein kinase, partial [Planctomycetota bacterium]|nr:serine/threonine-protein kinase [Planctomycetota bacterium]